MRLNVLIFAVVLGCIVSSLPTSAHAGWIEFFFPMLKDTSNDPANTLRAPFAEPEDEAEGTGEGNTGDGTVPSADQNANNHTVPMHMAHRSDKEVAQWVTTAVSEAVTFTDADHKAEMESLKTRFDPHGWREYQKFLTDTHIIKVIQSDRYQLRSYVKDTPLLLNEGPVSERYRWLYEVVADISYLDRNVSDYKDVEPQNRSLKIMVQIGRSPNAKNETGLLIERWDGKVVSSAK